MAPRERKPALAALAVLLILLGALGATVMVLRAGDKISVIEITENVAAGQPIPESAIREVDISAVDDVTFIRWNQRQNLTTAFVAAGNLQPHSVLTRSMITEKVQALAPGKSLIGLSLKEGQFPAGLKAGDTVAAYLVGDTTKSSSGTSSGTGDGTDTTGGSGNLISDHLLVETSPGGSGDSFGGDGSTTVNVLADDSDAGALTSAASNGDVALVLVPSKN